MGYMLLAGCMLVAFSMPLVLSFSLVLRRPQLLVTSIVAAFAWLIAFSVSAILWSTFTGVHNNEYSWLSVILAIILQELIRLVLIRAYFYTSQSFSAVGLHALMYPLIDVWAALACGLGFAVAQTSVLYAPVFMWAGEHGAMFAPTCSSMSVFTQSASTAACCGLIQLASFIVAMDAMRRRKMVFLPLPYAVNLLVGVLVSKYLPAINHSAKPINSSLNCTSTFASFLSVVQPCVNSLSSFDPLRVT